MIRMISLCKYGQCVLAFLLGYALKSFNIQSEKSFPRGGQQLANMEVELETVPCLLILIMTAPANSKVRDVIRKTWLSVSQKKHSFRALFVMGNADTWT